MNKFLAETVSFLNGFIALLSIVVWGLVGMHQGSQSQAEAAGIIVGLIIGFAWAIVVHGLLALFIQMYRELKAIRGLLAEASPVVGSRGVERMEPRIPTFPSPPSRP